MTPIVLMAGGRGQRLHPLTDTRPKPLLNVGGKPILEQIIDQFVSQGFKRFWISVGYKAELIERHFGNGSSKGLKIKYIHEDQPLGTAGSLNLLPVFGVPFIVSNADVLVHPTIQYGRLMEHHARSNAQATVCLGLHQYQVPYGVAVFEDERLVAFREKPIENIQVNAGIYVLDPTALAYLPEGRSDMTDLLDKLELSAYPIEGHWIDVGHFESYARANAEWQPSG